MKKVVLVTGTAGFIGFNTTKKLLENKFTVVGIDNLNRAYNQIFKQQNIKLLQQNSHFSFHKTDIRNQKQLRVIFDRYKIDKIIHFAARTGVRKSLQYPKLYFETNVEGTRNLYELAQKKSVQQFIFASSSSVYGNSNITPFSEKNKLPRVTSPYAKSKQRAEQIIKTLQKRNKMPTTILRFFSVYGPHGRPDMAPYIFTKKIFHTKPITQYGDGTTARDYTYIDDIVSGILKALTTPFDFEIINLGNNHPIKLDALVTIIESVINKQAIRNIKPRRKEESIQTWADINKAQKLLTWKPQTSFDKGIKQFVRWFIKNRLHII